MAIAPESLRYTPTHEWIRVEDGMAVMGITDFAVKLLTDIVFIALPQQGKTVRKSEPIGEIESVKAVSDLYAPVDGEIVETNQALPSKLELLSESPFDKAWISKIRLSDVSQPAQLMTADEYRRHCESSAH